MENCTVEAKPFRHNLEGCPLAVCPDCIITISKKLFFELLYSHSKLSEAEYNRNPKVNDKSKQIVVEQNIVDALPIKTLEEYFEWAKDKDNYSEGGINTYGA